MAESSLVFVENAAIFRGNLLLDDSLGDVLQIG